LELSAAQRDIVESPPGNLCILACAGSGKTSVIAHRIAHLVNTGIAKPSQVVAITFTVLAAQRLTLKIAELLADKLWASQIYAGTIHAFALQLLREFDPVKGERLGVISESQQFILLHRYWNDWEIEKVDPDKYKTDLILDLIATFGIIKMERVPVEEFQKRHPEIARVFDRYNEFLQANDYVDYADLIRRVVDTLEGNQELLTRLRARYRWFFIDEYQDVDPLQERLIRMLSGDQNLCVVGDDDQSIYQFRGTDVRNILRFQKNLPGSGLKRLEENFRCRRNIVAVAQGIVEENKARYAKEMTATRAGGRVVRLQFAHADDESSFIVKTIRALIDEGRVQSYRDIAVLIRSVASSGEPYINALRTADIPYITKGDRGLFRRPEAKRILGALEFIAKETSEAKHLAELYPAVSIDPEKLSKVTKDLAECLPGELVAYGFTPTEIDELQTLLDIKGRYYAGKFGTLLDILLDVIARLKLFHSEDPTVLYNISQITEIVDDFDEIQQTRKLHLLCAYLQSYAKRNFDEATPVESDIDAVSVLTIHQAKGLEFATVFCPMLVEARFPVESSGKRWLIDDDLFDSARYRTRLEDERRLCYVALTRARDFLYLTYSQQIPGLKREKEPSVFFTRAQRVRLPEAEGTIRADSSYRAEEFPLVTSYSAIEYYLTCPYRYLLLKIYGIKTPHVPFFEYGQSIHRALRLMHERYNERGSLSDADIEEIYEQHFQMHYNVPRYVVAKRKTAGLEALKRYFREKREWFDQVQATEQDFEYYLNGAVIRGRIDLLKRTPEGKREIVDFKTGEPHEYLRTELQMETYSLAATEQLHEDVGRVTLYYIELGQEKTFAVERQWLDEGKRELATAIEGIRKREFKATPGEPCKRCEVRKVCQYAI
jgi:DNA helicase II / ATP-dependent DNA helicase PcrA